MIGIVVLAELQVGKFGGTVGDAGFVQIAVVLRADHLLQVLLDLGCDFLGVVGRTRLRIRLPLGGGFLFEIIDLGLCRLCAQIHQLQVVQKIQMAAHILFNHFDEVQGCLQMCIRDRWEGHGGYTDEKANLYLTVVSKRESYALRKALQNFDPDAFVVINEDIDVVGNFEVRVM